MKKVRTLLSLLSMSFLVGCANPIKSSSPIGYTSGTGTDYYSTSSSESSSSSTPVSVSIFENNVYYTGIGDIDIGTNISGLGMSNGRRDVNFRFSEFGEKEFIAQPIENEKNYVRFWYDGTVIIEKMNYNVCFASDVNNDGYREIITLLDRDILIVYDAFNNREMFHKSLHYDELSSFYNPGILYSYQFWIYNEKLLLWIYDGSASQEVYDYAYLVFNSETNSLEVEPQNMFDLESMNFVSLYNGENMMNPDANGVYTIQKGVRYTINILFNRKENADPNKIIETFSTSKNYLSQGGIYAKLSEYFLSSSMESFVKNSKGNGFDKFEIKFKLDAGTEYSPEGELTIYYVGFSCSIKYKLAN